MGRKLFTAAAFSVLFLLGCEKPVAAPEAEKPDEQEPPEQPVEVVQTAPSALWTERLSDTVIKLNWRDNSDSETGYSVFLKNGEQVDSLDTVEADVTSYVLASALDMDTTYGIGVKAESKSPEFSSDTVWLFFRPVPVTSFPSGSVGSAVATGACFALDYTILNYDKLTNPEIGLCWSSEGTATYDENRLAAPQSKNGALQVISNLYLDYGTSYNVRPYVKADEGIFYIGSSDLSLKPEPEAVKFTWTKIDTPDLPEAVSVYETKDPIEGKGFHAYYAVADLVETGIEFRTNVPVKVSTIDEQSASFDGDCYVMINGGYFASGTHTGLAINDFRITGSINNQRGSISGSDPENTEIYPTARALFGVDDFGNPSVCWANGSGTALTYFSKPIPSVKGEAKYPIPVYEWASAEMVDFLPRAAISAAPVLLKDGKCPFDFTNTPKGSTYYYTNFEFVASDIFGSASVCDRTAIGVTEDGKVIMFICDGRMDSVPGVDLIDLARIMKGLGCVDAINLDGGGSTGMMVGDTHYGDITVGGNRKVMSTVGFFRRR